MSTDFLRITELPAKVYGMSMADYLRQPFDSRSFLLAVQRGGGESQLWLDKGKSLFSGNSATSIGSDFDAIVMGVIEGRSFSEQVCVPPDEVLGSNGSRSTKAYREWAESQTGIICTEDRRAVYSEMLDSLRGNDAAYDLITSSKGTQASVFAEVEGHGVKVRPDAETSSLWWDLKTTSSDWDSLFRSCERFGYYEQEWLYVQAAMALGLGHFRMPFVFVQTSPPYSCRVFRLPETLVENAGIRLRNTMAEVRLRRSTGVYLPESANEIQELEIPNWAMKEEEEVAI